MKGVQLVEVSKNCDAFAGDGRWWRHMNCSLNSARLHGGVGLLSSHAVNKTAYAGDVFRLLEGGGGGGFPWK